MHAAEIIDAATGTRVLVVGSLPPEGRDLDLLVDPTELANLAAALEREGFERYGGSWIRFADASAYAVDLIPWSDWELPAAELRGLLDDATPVDGFPHVTRPAPRHALLILARKLARERGALREKHTRRIGDELGRDANAWDDAAAIAAEWRAGPHLERLRARYEGRARSVPIRRPRRGAIVAFSGLDGSGKSTQADALARALEQLGWDTERVWVPLGSSATLQRIAQTGKRMLRRGRGSSGDDRLLWNPGGSAGPRSPALEAAAAAWSTAGTLANGLAHLRAGAAAAAGGKIVIFDRYVLDTIVHLRFTYGGVPHPAQERLAVALSPRPVAAYFLDLDPDAALARKQDWGIDYLRAQAELYRAEHDRLGVRRLDATRPADDLAADVAREVVTRLTA